MTFDTLPGIAPPSSFVTISDSDSSDSEGPGEVPQGVWVGRKSS
jgi:hypothetical protein